MQYLTRREADIIEAIGETLLPSADEGMGASEAGVAPYLDAYVGRLQWVEQLKLRALFQVIEYGMMLHTGRPGARFSRSDEDDRASYLEGWANSDSGARRGVFQALRSIVTMAYFANADVRDAHGEEHGEEVVWANLRTVVDEASRAIDGSDRDAANQPIVEDIHIDTTSSTADAPESIASGA